MPYVCNTYKSVIEKFGTSHYYVNLVKPLHVKN